MLQFEVKDFLEDIFTLRMAGAIPTGRATQHGFRREGRRASMETAGLYRRRHRLPAVKQSAPSAKCQYGSFGKFVEEGVAGGARGEGRGVQVHVHVYVQVGVPLRREGAAGKIRPRKAWIDTDLRKLLQGYFYYKSREMSILYVFRFRVRFAEKAYFYIYGLTEICIVTGGGINSPCRLRCNR